MIPRKSSQVQRRQFSTEKKSTKLWGGRFSRDTDASIKNWTESVTVDTHLVNEDIWGSMAHVSMLGKQGIIPPKAAGSILKTLNEILTEFREGKWALGYEQEDVHMNVESTVIKRIGMDMGGRMHTTRSRNDQVIVDSKLYARKRLLELRKRTAEAVSAFLERADKHYTDVMIGYVKIKLIS